MTDTAVGVSEFRVGQVLSRGFSVLVRNIVPFGLLALLIQLPGALLGWFFIGVPEATIETEISGLDTGTLAAFGAGGFLAVIVTMALNLAVTAALIYGTFEDLRGRRPGVGTCLARGLRLIPPMIGVAILLGLAVGFASILLIIPGIIVYVMLWVAIPVAVVERPGVIASLKRSAVLTKGNRWRIFGILLVVFVASGALQLLVSQLPLGIQTGLLALVVSLVLTALISAFWAVVGAVGYHDLRRVKDGVDTDEITAVFG